MATTTVLWQMMYRIKDLFIYLLILSTVHEHDQHKQLYANQTISRRKKLNKMRHFTVIADLNVAQKKSSMVTYLFLSALKLSKTGFVTGFVISAIYFRLKTIF